MKYSIAIAGSTKKTKLCAKALFNSDKFEITWILTPKPKPVGRKKTITPNPLNTFAIENNIPTIMVEKKINDQVKLSISDKQNPDFLLVVDFGYIIPTWLLDVPRISPLNIHPSELPKWRGSSPGQFSILFNDNKSAVTLMVMDSKLDHGPIIHQDFFSVNPNWTQTEYYEHAFKLICSNLDEKIDKYGKDASTATPQPNDSPTITARMLKKDHTFVPWDIVQVAINGGKTDDLKSSKLSKLLNNALEHNQSLPLTLERASKAFFPWPHLWTIIPTTKGEKRMKLLETEVNDNKLIIKTVQVEGKTAGSWADIKKSISE